jgi:hypothetical protein
MVNAAQIGILLLAGMVPLPWLPAISAVCCALGSELYRAFSKAFHTCHPCSATQTARTAHAVAFKPGCGSMIWFTDRSARPTYHRSPWAAVHLKEDLCARS